MKRRHSVAIFTDKFPFVGPAVWILCLQYFVAQLLAAAAWNSAYSWSQNVISDLGNTACGPYFNRYVCSPQHELMNASFIMLGITMSLGSLLIYYEFNRSRASLTGFILMATAGFGTLLVGLFPENMVNWLHDTGAFLTFGLGNLSLIILAFALERVRPSFRIYTFVSGVVSLVALALFLTHNYVGLGSGGVERVVSYPQTIWLILFGMYMTATRFRARHH